MPRAKKLPGQAADPRNGQQVALPAAPLAKFGLPRRSDGLKYDVRTQRMWRALWDDARLAAALSPVDRELVIRWAQGVDDWIKALESARLDPVTKGSMGQEVASPYFAIAAQALAVAERCEQQIGIGALNRARLGIAILAEARSLRDLSDGFPGPGGDGEPDPRVP
jgi:terminase small subunit-like protein